MAKKKGMYPEPEQFHPRNPDKYTGDHPIIARSSWEVEFMNFCDQTPAVLEWASEPSIGGKMGIPYRDPLTGLQKIYVPDFLVKYIDAGGNEMIKMIEIKPMHEAIFEFCRNGADEAVYHRNIAKWTAARAWCERRGIGFEVFTEQQLFGGYENKKPPVRKPEKQKKPGRTRKS